MTEVAPIRRHVTVGTGVDTAWALFTAHIGAWWPLAGHSVGGAGGLVAFEDGLLVERTPAGRHVWAEVTHWDPPSALRLSWHPGRPADECTEVAVTFTPDDGGTLVSVVHSGWQHLDAERAAGYGQGWPLVLDRLANRIAVLEGHDGPAPAADDDAPRWFALVHTPGPTLGPGESVFAHPLFAEHVAFLGRLRERGLLVAAGPVSPGETLDDAIGAGIGSGMTVVRLPAGEVADIADLARKDDLSVVGGLLEVAVQPWDVRFSA